MSQTQALAVTVQGIEERLAKLKQSFNETPTEFSALVEQKLGAIQAQEPDFFRDLMPTKADLPLLIAGLGAGSAASVSGFLQANVSQLSSYKPEYVEAIVGYLGYKYFLRKNQYVSAFAGGVVIGAIGRLAEDNGWTIGRLGIHGSRGAPKQSNNNGSKRSMDSMSVPL